MGEIPPALIGVSHGRFCGPLGARLRIGSGSVPAAITTANVGQGLVPCRTMLAAGVTQIAPQARRTLPFGLPIEIRDRVSVRRGDIAASRRHPVNRAMFTELVRP